MYINLTQTKKHLQRGDLELLCGLKQVDTGYLIQELSENDLERFKTLNFITEVKSGKKGDHPYSKLRLSDSAKKLLIECSFEGSPDEETKKIADWVFLVVKGRSGGIVKNKTECIRRLQWYKTISGISGNFLAILIQCFMTDTYDSNLGLSVKEFMESNPRGVLNNMADNIFFSPTSMFDKHYTLDKSPLQRYFEENEKYVKDLWNQSLDEFGNKK